MASMMPAVAGVPWTGRIAKGNGVDFNGAGFFMSWPGLVSGDEVWYRGLMVFGAVVFLFAEGAFLVLGSPHTAHLLPSIFGDGIQ
jgi:hypothetical protein